MKNNRPAYSINLAIARKRLKLNQYQLSEMIHKSRDAYCKYESGGIQPSHETWFLLCVVLEIEDLKGFMFDKDYFVKKTNSLQAA